VVCLLNSSAIEDKRSIPNFVCLGAQKAGTTTLHEILKDHPSIFLPERKEAHFFDQQERYSKGITWWLSEFFYGYNNEPIIGVMTPEYLFYAEVPERIHQHLGQDVKFVVILRHPVDRAYSHYLMSKRRGFEKLPFTEAIELEEERIHAGDHEKNHFSYLSRGYYSEQIDRYMKLYPRDQFLFLSFENDIRDNLNNSIQRIQEFLNVEFIELDTTIKSNRAAESKSQAAQHIIRGDHFLKRFLKLIIPTAARRKLKQRAIQINEQKEPSSRKLTSEEKTDIFNRYYSKEIETLNKLTGYDFSYWEKQK
jgi:Sulfotransferase domain